MADNSDKFQQVEALVKQVVTTKASHQQVLNKYDDWTATYDEDMKNWGFKSPLIALNELHKLLGERKDVKILDVCAGTGLTGQALYNDGYTDIDFHDGSDKMKQEALKKNVYNGKFFDAFLGKDRIDSPDDVYDVITIVCSLCDGHVSEDCFSCFREFARILKPGGIFYGGTKLTCVKPKFQANIEKYLNELVKEGVFEWVYEGTRVIKLDDFEEATWILRAC